jgi:hypothetical protein
MNRLAIMRPLRWSTPAVAIGAMIANDEAAIMIAAGQNTMMMVIADAELYRSYHRS